MNRTQHEGAIARQPQQPRSRERFDAVLDAAEALIEQDGVSAFSIPALAERLSFPRASIYKFFPTPYAVLNELVQRKLGLLEKRLVQMDVGSTRGDWREVMRASIHEAVGFYNSDPVARLLLLGGAVSDDSHRALEFTIQRLGGFTRQLLDLWGIKLPRRNPDAAMVLVELGTACFRLSQFLHGEITPQYRDEAVHAMEAYLSRYTVEIDRRARKLRTRAANA